jgi:pilus assembly protein CpaB
MGAARIIILSIALVAAVGLAVVIRNMLATGREPVAVAQAKAPETPMTRVLVAKRDLPVGTRLQPDDLTWQSWPAAGINPMFITDGSNPAPTPDTPTEKAAEGAGKMVEALTGNAALEGMTGAVVREPILANEPVQQRKLVRGGEGGYLAVVLRPGMRAIGVPVSVESGAGGFILPGDRVDVLQSREVETVSGGARTRVTESVVVNVRVLAIDQKTTPDEEAQALVGTVATLEVDIAAAEALVDARPRGEMQLVLRSYADAGGPSGRTARAKTGVNPTVRVFSQGETTETVVPR